MSIKIVMPKLGLTMSEGMIVEWCKKEGDQVSKGDTVYILETEKVTYEVESPGDGILSRILVPEGETVLVGEPVVYLLVPGEDNTNTDTLLHVETKPNSRVKASPNAKKLAKSFTIDLQTIHGTGPGGMISRSDVEKAHEAGKNRVALNIKSAVETDTSDLVPLSGMRRAIAQKMLASKVETAQTYMSNTVDAGNLVKYRQKLLPEIQDQFGIRVTITDILMKIATQAILKHPVINTRWTEKGILYLKDVNMGMAMALDNGLMVPVIQNMTEKNLGQIAKARLDLIRKRRENGFLPDDITGSTFTLSSLGMYSVEQFTANINLPENAILAVGAIIDKPVAVGSEVVIRPIMNITLSYDHRTIDGVEAAKFLRTLKSFIENPGAILEGKKTAGTTAKKKVTIIGGGVGGYPAAIKAARLGAEVVLIEKDRMGGVCLNRGCIPTKALLQSCKVIKTMQQSDLFGVECKGYQTRLKAIMDRKNTVVEQLRNGVEKLLLAKRIKIIKGTAKIIDATTVQISETSEKIQSDKIIIASGSLPRKINIKGSEGSGIWNSNDILQMEHLPKSVVIIGGGAVGIEFAQILKRLNVDVTILEMMENLCPGLDKEIAAALEKLLTDEGINVYTHAVVKQIRHQKTARRVDFAHDGELKGCRAEKVLVSVGRDPDLDWIDLDKIGLAKKNGALLVNKRMETNIPGIYAVGDVTGGMMLAHVAMAEGECAAKNVVGQESRMDYHAIPSCIYTSPEVASVGLSEEKAKEEYDVQVGRFSFHGSGKALIIDETCGMVKTISDRKTGKILGVHIIGPRATDMIGEAVLGISKHMTVQDLAEAVLPHPSLSETVMESALSLCGGAIHMP